MSTSVADVSLLLTNTQGAAKTQNVNPNPSETQSFTSYMNTTAGKSERHETVNEGVKQTKTVVEKPGRKDLGEQQTDYKEVVKKEGEDLTDAVTESITEVKDAILEKFDISDEELISVMETMQISMVDLLNPDIVKELMVTLNGQEDVVSALTDEALYTDMMDIVNLASDLTNEIKEEFALTDEEFAQLIENVREMESDVLEQANVSDENEIDQKTSVIQDEKPETKAPQIRVEVERTEETRTADPIVSTGTERTPLKQATNIMQQQQNETKDEHDLPMQTDQPQQITTSTQQVGDVVETVRTFSSQVNGQEIVQQVTDFIKVNISPESTSMELQLHPASLGAIHMHIESQNGVITAQMLVQNESVKAALESQLMQLQETFAEQGTKVEAVEVAVASYDLDRGPFQDRDDRQDRQNADSNSRGRRRINLNLNDPNVENLELNEEDQLAKDVMEMNGTNVDFSA